MASSIEPARILKELDQLWIGLGSEPQEDGSVGVLRACSLTIFALSAGKRESAQLPESFAGLLEEHPGRFVDIRVSREAGRSLEAKVSAQCWMPFGKRRHICVEQVNIDAGRDGMGDLAPVLRALRVPDLPAVLWCRDARMLEDDRCEELAALCDKLVVNTGGHRDPAGMAAALLQWRRSGTVVADLSWTRLTRWRETIAQLFGTEASRERLGDARKVTITYFGESPGLRAAYLAAWFREVLGEGPEYVLASAGDQPPCQQKGEVQAAAIDGPDLHLSIRQVGGESVEIRFGDLINQTMFHEVDEAQLLREELSIEDRDTVFEAVLERAGDFVHSSR